MHSAMEPEPANSCAKPLEALKQPRAKRQTDPELQQAKVEKRLKKAS